MGNAASHVRMIEEGGGGRGGGGAEGEEIAKRTGRAHIEVI